MTVVDLSQDFAATSFFSGMSLAIFGAAGLFFFKFWRKTREPFFAVFGAACWMLSAERVPLLLYGMDAEAHSWVYFMRLSAFVLIMVAIVRANRRQRSA